MWYSFDLVHGQLCQRDGTQWHAFNPDYDPGPPPPPRLPREVKASMIITTESNGETSSTTTARKKEQPNKFSKPERNPYLPYLAPSTSQQSPSVGASSSTQQWRSQGQRAYERNPQFTSKNSGYTLSRHRPTGAQYVSPAPWLSGPSSDIRNGLGQSTEHAQAEKGYPKRPYRRPRHPASQDAPTANNS